MVSSIKTVKNMVSYMNFYLICFYNIIHVVYMALYTLCVVTYSFSCCVKGISKKKNIQSKSTHYLTIQNENLLQPAFLTHVSSHVS